MGLATSPCAGPPERRPEPPGSPALPQPRQLLLCASCLCSALCSSAGTHKFFDAQSGVRLTAYWRVATINFPEEKENICPLNRCRVPDRGERDKRRAVRNVRNICTVGGAVMVEGKILYRLVALENSRNGKSSFDADDVLAREAWEVDVLFGVVGGCGSGDHHQVRLLKKLLIWPNANEASGDHAGGHEKESSRGKK